MEKRENHGGKIMKRVLYSVCIGSLALALTAGAAQDNKKKPERARPQHRTASVHTARPANTGRTMSAHRNVSAAQYRQPSYAKPRASSNAVVKHDTGLRAVRERNLARNERMRERNSQEFRARRDVEVNRDRNVAVNRTRNADINRYRNANEFRGRNNVAINRNRNFAVNRTQNASYYRRGNVRITNNWRGDAFRGQRYAAFRNYNRQWHDRSWWRS